MCAVTGQILNGGSKINYDIATCIIFHHMALLVSQAKVTIVIFFILHMYRKEPFPGNTKVRTEITNFLFVLSLCGKNILTLVL